MTATATPAVAAATPAVALAAATPGPGSDLPDSPVRRGGTATPITLRRLAIACVVTAAVAGVFMAATSFQRASRLNEAAATTRQLVTLTDARSQVAAADAAATDGFLVGGIEPPAGRTAYLAALDAATADINTAAESGIGDQAALIGVAQGVGTYRGTIEYARALNRKGLPLGSAYLRDAGTTLATEVIAPLDTEIANTRNAIGTSSSPVLVVLTVIALVVFAACFLITMWMLLQRTRRYLNLGVVVGAAAILVVFLGWIVVTLVVNSSVDSAVSGPLSATTEIAQVRADAFDARSAQNLVLISRGTDTGAYTQRLNDDIADARDRLGRVPGSDGVELSQAFEGVATQLKTVSDTNDDPAQGWDKAVPIETGRTIGVGPAFDRFDQVSSGILTTKANDAVDGLTSGRPWLIVVGIAALLAGAGGAVAAWLGISVRRKEYS